LSNFTASGRRDKIILLKGYAGTGKTTLVSAYIKALNEFKIKTQLLAPTGRAAKVLSNYSGFKAYTIHKKIYRQKSSKDAFGKFDLNVNLQKDTIFIVDEASMISNAGANEHIFGSGRLLNDLIEFVYSCSSCSLILVGDSAQLPPVEIADSPALQADVLRSYGFDVDTVVLTEVVRQELDSGILFNATMIRQLVDSIEIDYPKMLTQSFNDCVRITGAELIEELANAYAQFGLSESIVLCYSNKRANIYNQGIRNRILYREEEISSSDILMVVKNNYFWAKELESIDFIANGDIVRIKRIKKFQDAYGFRFADIVLELPDYDNEEIDAKIFLDALSIESAAMPFDAMNRLYLQLDEEYNHIKSKKDRYKLIRENPYFNALQVKFAYAITTHKAQGGQWSVVFLDQGYFKAEMLDLAYLRWLYTGITRATQKIYFVNFSDDFFEK
jgi:exodeoxyribonuclease-5